MSANNMLGKSAETLPRRVQVYPFLYSLFLPGVFVTNEYFWGFIASVSLSVILGVFVWWKGSLFSNQRWILQFGGYIYTIHLGAMLVIAYIPALLFSYYLLFGLILFYMNVKNFKSLEHDFISGKRDASL